MGVDYKIADVKCISTKNIHISAMLSSTHQRGIKRKLDHNEGSEITKDTDIQQRLCFFHISKCKLDQFRKGPDPRLLPSVLLYNTVRILGKELEEDGYKISYECNQFPSSNHTVSELNINHPNMPQISFNSSMSTHPVSLNDTDNLKCDAISPINNDESCDINSEYSKNLHDLQISGRITPFVRTNDKMDTGALCLDENDRLTSLNWSSVLNFSTLENNVANVNGFSNNVDNENPSANVITQNQVPADYSPSLHTLMPPATVSQTVSNNVLPSIMLNFSTSSTTMSASPSVSLSPLTGSSYASSSSSCDEMLGDVDEIFGDVNVTLYDYDVSPHNMRMAPMTAEELIRSLSNEYENASFPSSNIYNRQDDRDHITFVQS
ncbi:uncharacterized protein LOC111620111 isoform X1 [Centruroides sculpturatus]|uniref:uncharacterized protein LOC111620111 isoform X1 n=2 Tax=Centruroides sculpturatus TaxID=218467 RepID=UPI000C6E6217|nr:uncharacterized protein LOC111620111 isoform X1 [Centruroides sculpturatus]